jgi:hypothetical protein
VKSYKVLFAELNSYMRQAKVIHMTTNEVPSTGRYQVIKSEGAQCWYIQEIATGELVTVTFRTKKAATQACARRNLPAEMKQQSVTAQYRLIGA